MFFDSHNKIVKKNRFLVFVGPMKISFARVSGFEQTLEEEMLSEGGVNGYAQLLINPIKGRHVLRFERGVQSLNPMLGMMNPGVSIPLGITVIVLNNNSFPVQTYHLSDVVVTKWEVSDFSASESEVLIETFELSYTEIQSINMQLF